MTAKTMPNYVEVVDKSQGVVYASRGNQHIDTARDAWREYATIFDNTTACPDLREVYDGVHIMWVGSDAYIIAHDEVYRVDDAWTAKHKLRKRVVLHRIGRYDDCSECMAAAVADAAGLVYDRAQ